MSDAVRAYPTATAATRRGSLADEVAVYIRHLVLTGVLRPGERIDQEAVSEALDVSRSPIREAVVVPRPGRVADPQPEPWRIRGRHHARATSPSTTNSSAPSRDGPRRSPRNGCPMRRSRSSPSSTAASNTDHTPRCRSRNHDFHRLINRGAPAGTRWLLALLERSVPADYYEFSAGVYADAVDDHAAVLAAITERDPDEARRAMEHHLRQGGAAAARGAPPAGLLEGRRMTTDERDHDTIRTEVRRLCDKYGNEYWRVSNRISTPTEFVDDLTTPRVAGCAHPRGVRRRRARASPAPR